MNMKWFFPKQAPPPLHTSVCVCVCVCVYVWVLFLYPVILCLLVATFNPFMVKVIIDVYVLTATLLSVLNLFPNYQWHFSQK